MPSQRFYRLPFERQQEILVAAAKVLGENGYDNTSLNQILEQAGLSKGAAYYYFENKNDLVATVFFRLWEHSMSAVQLDLAELNTDNFWHSIFEFGRKLVESAKNEPWTISAMKAVWGLPAGARTTGPLANAFTTIVNWAADILRRGQKLGAVRTDLSEELMLALIMAIDETSDRWLVRHWEEFDPTAFTRHSTLMFDIVRRILTPINRDYNETRVY